MPEHMISTRTYYVVATILVLLAILTVGLSFIHVPYVSHLVVGLIIATCKATLVVLFFMHALISSRLTWIVIAVVTFWVGILVVLTLTDYFTRGLVPFTPGH